MKKQRKWVIVYLITFFIMIAINYISGRNIGSIANDKQAIIQPAGFAFAIWGLIYILILIWLIKLFKMGIIDKEIVHRLKYLPIINFLLNSLWIIVYTKQWFLVSVIVILALLYNICRIYVMLFDYLGYNRFPFSIYLGWTTVATIVNIFSLALNNNLKSILGLNELTWTIFAIIMATLITYFIAISFRDWLLPLVVIWPFFGIYVENRSNYLILDITLFLVTLLLLIITVIMILKRRSNKV